MEDLAREMAEILFIDALASEIEEHGSSELNREIHGELTETIPAMLEAHGVNMDKFVNEIAKGPALLGFLGNVNKLWAGKCTVEEAHKEYGDQFSYQLAMQAVGHGVGLHDDHIGDELDARGCQTKSLPHIESPYDQASECFDAIVKMDDENECAPSAKTENKDCPCDDLKEQDSKDQMDKRTDAEIEAMYDGMSNDEIRAQHKAAMSMLREQIKRGDDMSPIAMDAKRHLMLMRKVMRAGGMKLEGQLGPSGLTYESGEKFKKLEKELEKKGAKTPAALAAWIGRKNMGKAAFQKKAAAGKKHESVQLREGKLDDRARKLIAEFEKAVGIDKAVLDKIGEKQIGDIAWRYGGREVSASTPEGMTFIWDVNSYGDRHSYMLFDIQDENGGSVEESKKMESKKMEAKKDMHADASLEPSVHDKPSDKKYKELKKAQKDGAPHLKGKTDLELANMAGMKSMHEAKDWLPRTLSKEHEELVSEVSNKLSYDINAAMAFAVALLEDVNAHPEAAAVNAALTHMAEAKGMSKELDEAKGGDKVLEALDDVRMNSLEGGKGDEAKPSDFDLEQVLKGVVVEMEHTKDSAKALDIVCDHLAEKKDYYTKLEKVEVQESKKSMSEETDSFGIPLMG